MLADELTLEMVLYSTASSILAKEILLTSTDPPSEVFTVQVVSKSPI